MQDKEKPNMQLWQREIRCPIHKCLLGKYDCRIGVINTTYYCHKCGIEYTYTIAPKKIAQKY